MAALSKKELLRRLGGIPPLVENMPDPGLQIQENGIELTVREIARFVGEGALALDNRERMLAETETLPFDSEGWVRLKRGPYLVTYTETVNVPLDLIAVGRPRSSLMRSGATIESAVWDAGYSGRGQGLLVVSNRSGLRLKQGARVIQLVFYGLSSETEEGYGGMYQNEGK
jgi:dUTP pyrophosphatase